MKDNQAKYPQLRFKGFTDPWEQRKLSDLFIKGGSGGTPKSTNKSYYDGEIPFLGISDISNSNGFIYDTEKHITEEGLNNSSAWMVPSGAISLAMYASVGKLAILKTDVATSQAFYNLVFDDENIRDYVYQRLSKANELGEWTKLISTGTQANLNADKVKNFEISIPTDISEISNISTLFKKLDETITLHQRKLAKLKKLKQGYFQKLFPQNGSKFPQLRFAGFADAWEQRKFSDLTKLSQGLQIPIANRYTNPGAGRYFYITNEFLNPNSNTKFYIKNPPKNVISTKNDILMTRTGNTGKVVTDVVGAFHNNFFKIDYDGTKLNKNFLYNLLLTFYVQKEILIRAGNSTIADLNHSDFYKIKVQIPQNIHEQELIGTLLKKIDSNIASNQRKLEKLQELKKGYLQKMFC